MLQEGYYHEYPEEPAVILQDAGRLRILGPALPRRKINLGDLILDDTEGQMWIRHPEFETPRFPRRGALLAIRNWMLLSQGILASDTDMLVVYMRRLRNE